MSRAALIGVAIFCLTPSLGQALADIIGSKGSKVYHTHPESCPSAKKISKDGIVHFATVKDAEAAGRRLCRTCAKLGETDKPHGPVTPPKAAPAKGISARVAKILPGGTLQLDNGEKVTLLGAGVPLARQPYDDDTQKFIELHTTKGKVLLQSDEPAPAPPKRDALGRMRCYVMCHEGKFDLAAELIIKGLAWVDRDNNCERGMIYSKNEDEAWWAKRGIWKPLDGPAGKDTVIAGKRTWQYHSAGCSHVKSLTEPTNITINEAKARRLVPCPSYKIKKAD